MGSRAFYTTPRGIWKKFRITRKNSLPKCPIPRYTFRHDRRRARTRVRHAALRFNRQRGADLDAWQGRRCDCRNGREKALAPLVPAAHHLRLLAELERLEDGDDRPADGADAARQRQIDLCIGFVPGVVAASPAAQLGDRGLPYGGRWRNISAGRCAGWWPSMRKCWDTGWRRAIARRGAGRRRTGGSYFATGVRGPITGRRADLVVIDDPIKSHAEADSALHRDHAWDWYRSDLVTRLRPGARVVVVMTRWHPDDLGGRLLETGDGLDGAAAAGAGRGGRSARTGAGRGAVAGMGGSRRAGAQAGAGRRAGVVGAVSAVAAAR